MTICIARAGKEIGRWPAEEIPSLMEAGTVLPTDYARVQGEEEWLLVIEHPALGGKRGDAKKAAAAAKRADVQKQMPTNNSPWLIALAVGEAVLLGAVVVGVLTGFGMMQTEKMRLASELKAQSDKRTELERKVSELESRLFVYEPVEPGVIKGRLTYVIGKKSGGMPGAEVVLFRREDVEKSLLRADEEMRTALAGQIPNPAQAGQFFFKRLSPALQNSLTDASGYFQFPLPAEEGQYVIASRAVLDSPKKQSYFWLVSFDAARAAQRPIILDTANAIQRFRPEVMVVPAD